MGTEMTQTSVATVLTAMPKKANLRRLSASRYLAAISSSIFS